MRPPQRKSGGFFSFFTRIFSRNRSVAQPRQEDLIREEENEVNGGISGEWGAKNDAASYITELPEKGSFLRDFERPYNEPVNRAPVFESSSFFRGIGMHSYMGLRYTRLDTETGFIMRKRIGVGFGSGSGPANYGKINNEYWNLTDGSSETPITIDGLNNTIRSIEATKSNIEAAKNSGAAAISDTVLFSDNNSTSDNLRPMGNLLLIALGKGNLVKTTNSGLGTVRGTNRLLSELRTITKKENAQAIFGHVEKFAENRAFLTTEQIGKLLLNGILFATGHGRLAALLDFHINSMKDFFVFV